MPQCNQRHRSVHGMLSDSRQTGFWYLGKSLPTTCLVPGELFMRVGKVAVVLAKAMKRGWINEGLGQ